MNEHSKTRVVVGTIPTCIDLECTGWIVDTIIGKYWIKCMDAKHTNQQDKSKEVTN
jgi:hypothetical protein